MSKKIKVLFFLMLLPFMSHMAIAKGDLPEQRKITKAQKKQYHAELMKVVDDFQDAIKKKDGLAFADLMYTPYIPWIGIYKDQPWAAMVNNLRSETWWSFINWAVNYEGTMEERIYNVEIRTDGVIASLYFDYSFFTDEKLSHWGKESWELIRTMHGWKINSVTYSIELPEEKIRKEIPQAEEKSEGEKG